jgi:hypothetical protein
MPVSQIETNSIANGAVAQVDLAAGVAGNGPTFSSYPSATQTLTTGVNTKLQYNLEEWDTASCYNTSDFRFTPNVAGYYQVSGAIGLATTSALPIIVTIYKNGSAYKQGTITSGVNTSFPFCGVSALVYLNGTTDYVELFAMSPGGTLSTWSAALTNNYFQAALVRAA